MQHKFLNSLAALFAIPLLGVVTFSVIPQFWAYWLSFFIATVVIFSVSTKTAWTRISVQQVSFFWLILIGITVIQWMLHLLHSHAVAITAVGYLLAAMLITIVGQYYRNQVGFFAFANLIARITVLTALSISTVLLLANANLGLFLKLTPFVKHYSTHALPSIALGGVSLLYLASKTQRSVAYYVIAGLILMAGLSMAVGAQGWWVTLAILLMAVLQQMLAIKSQQGSRQKRDWTRYSLVLFMLFVLVRLLTTDLVLQSPSQWSVLLVAAKIAFNHLWLGVGVGNVGWHTFTAIALPAIPGRVGVFYHAPNAMMQLFLEFGIFAVIALVIALFGWFKAMPWKKLTAEHVWLISTVMMFIVVGMLSAPFHQAYYLLAFALLIGAGEEKRQTLKQPVPAALVSFLVGLGLLVAITSAGIANAKLIQAARGSLGHPDTIQQLQWVDNKSVLSPYAKQLFAKKIEVDGSSLKTKLWVTDSVMHFQPEERIAFYHTVLLELSGKHAQAVTYLDATLKAYPIKLNDMLAYYSPMYMQIFLNVLLEARPPKKPAQTQSLKNEAPAKSI